MKYKTTRNVSANPDLKRVYINNSKRAKELFSKMENARLYGIYIPFAKRKQIKDKIDEIIEVQLAIREKAFELKKVDCFYVKKY